MRTSLLSSLFLFLALPMTSLAQNNTPLRTVMVSGEGILHVLPDQATIRFGVVTRADDAETARQRNAEAARDAMNAVRALGIDERKIRLETLSLQPMREYDQNNRRWLERGYEAVRQVVVEVNDLDQLPYLVADIVAQGANRLNGIQYDLSNRQAIENQALQAAVRNAREKAELMATTLDASLGLVQQVSEQGLHFPRPMMAMADQMRGAKLEAAASPEPEAYAAGEIEVRAQVQVVFALE